MLYRRARILPTPLAAIALAVAIAVPSRALAQLSIPGKIMTYSTVDTDSHEELLRTRVWQVGYGHVSMEISKATYPVGTELTKECVFGNGIGRPATYYRSVLRSASGEIERSDFDTYDPTFYPFLTLPVTEQMQPVNCQAKNALDLPAVIAGGTTTMWVWSDSGLVGAIAHGEGEERLSVAAGTFDVMRIRIDTDLSKLFPHVPALFLKLVKPHFTIWVTRAEPYYIIKAVGFSDGGPHHTNTALELASMAGMVAGAWGIPPELGQADDRGVEPPLTLVNSGSFAQGDRTGRVTLSTASIPEGDLLVTHVAFNNGLATESRTLIDHRASPTTVYLDDRSFATSGAIVRKHVLFFRKAAFPDDPDKDLPADLYGGDTTLGLVLPRVLPDGVDEARFHVMDFYGQVNELSIRKEGEATVALASDDAPAIHAKLKPILDIPLLLRPLAYFFVPTFDAYFEADPSHRLLKFEGPLGPPGVPNATMIADEKGSPSQTH